MTAKKSTKPAKKKDESPKDGSVKFEITIKSDAIKESYNKNLAKLAESVEIKGFRKGKAPTNLVEKQIDKNKLYSHVLDEVIPPVYLKHLTDNKLAPLTQPQINPISMEEGKDWKFSVQIVTRPPIELGDYKKYVKKALADHKKEHKHEEAKDDKAKEKEREHTLTVIFDALLKNAKLAVSPMLIEEEAKNALSRLVKQLENLNATIDDYAKSIKKTQEELVKEYMETAETNIRLEFILGAIVEDIDPKVDDKEITEMKPGKGQEAYARYLVQKRKVLDFLTEL